MPPPEASNSVVLGPEKSSLAEVLNKYFKISITYMFKDLRYDSVNTVIYQQMKQQKIIQEMNIEFNKEVKYLKKTQTKIKMEMKK